MRGEHPLDHPVDNKNTAAPPSSPKPPTKYECLTRPSHIFQALRCRRYWRRPRWIRGMRRSCPRWREDGVSDSQRREPRCLFLQP